MGGKDEKPHIDRKHDNIPGAYVSGSNTAYASKLFI
jgi:hypothetical protein